MKSELFFFVIAAPLLEFTRLRVCLAHGKPLSFMGKSHTYRRSEVRITNQEHRMRTLYPHRHLAKDLNYITITVLNSLLVMDRLGCQIGILVITTPIWS